MCSSAAVYDLLDEPDDVREEVELVAPPGVEKEEEGWSPSLESLESGPVAALVVAAAAAVAGDGGLLHVHVLLVVLILVVEHVVLVVHRSPAALDQQVSEAAAHPVDLGHLQVVVEQRAVELLRVPQELTEERRQPRVAVAVLLHPRGRGAGDGGAAAGVEGSGGRGGGRELAQQLAQLLDLLVEDVLPQARLHLVLCGEGQVQVDHLAVVVADGLAEGEDLLLRPTARALQHPQLPLQLARLPTRQKEQREGRGEVRTREEEMGGSDELYDPSVPLHRRGGAAVVCRDQRGGRGGGADLSRALACVRAASLPGGGTAEAELAALVLLLPTELSVLALTPLAPTRAAPPL